MPDNPPPGEQSKDEVIKVEPGSLSGGKGIELPPGSIDEQVRAVEEKLGGWIDPNDP